MDFIAFKEAVIAKAEAMGIAEYELYYEAAQSTSVSVFQQQINQFSSSNEGGVCLRCIVDGKMGYAATEALDAQQAQSLVERAVDNARNLESEEPVFLTGGGKSYTPLDIKPYDLPETEELIAGTLETQRRLYAADPAVVDGSTTQGISESTRIAIYNSKGLDLQYENNISGYVVGAVIAKGEEKSNDYQIRLGRLDTLDTQALTAKAVRKAMEKLGGAAAPTAVCPVVFDPEAMSDLLETFAGIFSSENAQKGLSRLAGQEGQRIASEFVTLIDDPFHKDNPMPINFDAEGSVTYTKPVIEQGVLKTLLYNLKTAAVAGRQTTGNASKSGYASPVGIRPFTMYIAPGELTQTQLLEKAGDGVYICSLSGLHAGANPVSGDFSLQSEGFLIENGVKTRHVKSFTVAGNFYELLKRITAVADDTCLPMAMGMTAFGAPSVLVEGLSIAGK